MIVVDKLLIGGISFVLRRIAEAVESELNDDSVLKEELLAAQMRLELGEITEDEFAQIETEILARMKEIQERKRRGAGEVREERPASGGKFRVESVEASLERDEDVSPR